MTNQLWQIFPKNNWAACNLNWQFRQHLLFIYNRTALVKKLNFAGSPKSEV